MESKFTRGEWEVVYYTTKHHGFDKVFAYEVWSDNVCVVGKTNTNYAGNKINNELLANAHLISAAPELYNEVEMYISLLNALIEDGHTGYIERRNRVVNSLAKARGEI